MTFTCTEPPFWFVQGSTPLVVSLPHSGTHAPASIVAALTPQARVLPDTDWHLGDLYRFAGELGASVISATHSRYVIDVNRPPAGANILHGERVTGVCPIQTFDGMPIYEPGQEPDDVEIEARRAAVWHPYHAQLSREIERVRAQHGVAVLWDAHSLRSQLPQYFDGSLPDINIGTNKGSSCDAALSAQLVRIAGEAQGYSSSINGRFTGGYITRHYGKPSEGVHALQCEITHRTYMHETYPYDYLPEEAAQLQAHLRRMIEATLEFALGQTR